VDTGKFNGQIQKNIDMNLLKIIFAGFFLLLLTFESYSQDKRTTETKVADILSRLPANDLTLNNKLMGDMLLLGEAGIKTICNQVIPAGKGDDTSPRYAVESLSRFVSQKGKEAEKVMWEKICIGYATGQKDFGVQDFFMKQLQLVGGNPSAEAMKIYLTDKQLCEPALAVIAAVGGKTAEAILAESLKNKDIPCAASVMKDLALMKSKAAINEYIYWASSADINIKASAYTALAQSGSSLAYPVLSKAAKDVSWQWEPTGATASLLGYAKVIGQNGDIKTMDKICKLVMKQCSDDHCIQNKTAALDIYTGFHGMDAMPELIKAASHPVNAYRVAAMRMSLAIPGAEVTKKWIDYYPKAIPAAKPEIITMLGLRGDAMALPILKASLSDPDLNVREATAPAIVKLSGKKAIPALIAYMLKFSSDADQFAAKSAIMSVAGSDDMPLLIPVLKSGQLAAAKTAIELMAWNKGNSYFPEVLPFTVSQDEAVKTAAFKALASLAGPADQEKLIELLNATEKPEYIADIQKAVVAAANQISDPEKRSETILKYLDGRIRNEKLIPVLAETGGRKALELVLAEYDHGSTEMQDICVQTIANWKDYSASTALLNICASGNKTYEVQAFEGYVKQIKTSALPDEEKLLLYRKIMPYARNAEMKNEILTEIGKLKTYQSLFFVASYLDDPATSATAARAAMSIALPSAGSTTGLYGDKVKEILRNTVSKLQGSESEYEKTRINKYLEGMPADAGFVSMFNGKDLTGWQGLVGNPIERAKMKPADLVKKQAEADKKVLSNWSVKDGCIWFNGTGDNLCSIKQFGDFEMMVDWKISKGGDSGIYLKGSPQVQIWDTARVDVGAQVGSGGLYNNKVNPSKPLKVADNPVGDWNTFRILMTGEKVSVWLNGELVVDNIIMENYWDRNIPIFPMGAIELQAHGTDLAFRDIYVREINTKEFTLSAEEKAEGFVPLFNGKNLDNWTGDKGSYHAEDGVIVVKPSELFGGNLYTEKEYSDFIIRFEFQLTPAANNGLGIRAPLEGDAAYMGMEIQILDNTAPAYADLQPYQYHGSVYGVIPAKREFLKPVGEWNSEEVFVKGTRINVILNGTTIVDGDISGPRDSGTLDHKDHPGLKNKTGHIGFLGHGSEVKFRNIRIKDISQ
jgi:HEAT repeat protein